jgi:alpha-beta hydrolase superfamily lysophospholipase
MSGSGEAAGSLVTFRSASGRLVTGLLTEADQRPAPAVVLVPMLGRSKDDWQAVAEHLAAGGIHALAIDLPGLALPADLRELEGWSEDVRAAVTFLAGRGDVRPGAVGLVGASLGASLVAVAAAADPGVPSIALVSPSLEYRGVRIAGAMQRYGARQAFFVASVQDPYAARSVRELQKMGGGSREVRWSDVPAHGTALLSRDPDLIRSLVEWFQQTLG